MDSQPSKRPTLLFMLGNVGRGVVAAAACIFLATFSDGITDRPGAGQDLLGFSLALPILLTLAWLVFASYRYYKKRLAHGFSTFNINMEIAFGIFLYTLSTGLFCFIFFIMYLNINGGWSNSMVW
ncbi:MAG: hypothetical protein LBC35_05460 [Coriobacteriales bacterium]|jgi:hypothetical protein|nr:hypothetical protein [Coriobacteriales bacterium]